MFQNLRNHRTLPIQKSSLNQTRWTLLFLFDQLFGFSNRRKNSEGKTLKKLENQSYIGRRYQKIHNLNVKKMRSKNASHQLKSPYELPEIDSKDFLKEDFHKWKKDAVMPIAIRGFLKDAPILDLLSEENLVSNYGETRIKCVADIDEEKGESRIGQNIPQAETSLRDFITSDSYENHYINNFYGLLNNEDFLNLCRGKDLEEIQGQNNVISQWFLKRGLNSGSTLHCAGGENIFLNIQGKKEWHFIHPSYTSVLQTSLSKYGVYAISEIKENLIEDFCDQVNEQYDYFRDIPIYRVVLEPGDILYNPPWWWHTVRNITPYTVGCATRWFDMKQTMTNSPTLYAGQMVELIKNPKKSLLFQATKNLSGKDKANEFINSIFSGEKEKVTS